MSTPVIAFLPCRSGSQRVPFKNTRSFSGFEGGLTEIKIYQLLACAEIDRIIVSTDDEVVANIVHKIVREEGCDIEVVERPSHLATSDTSTDDLIKYVPTVVDSGIVLWTHVTSPFVTSDIYKKSILEYHSLIDDGVYDSLMSVSKLQSFVWNRNGPVNYDRNIEKWPRTQTLPEMYEVNSAFFISKLNSYLEMEDRIGDKPYLYELEGVQTIDIDWQKDFILAEKISLANKELLGKECLK